MKKSIFRILVILALVPVVYFVSILFYVWFTDYIPERIVKLSADTSILVEKIDSDTLTFFDWNIGYSGLGRESDFFYDGGQTVVAPAELVEKNLNGILQTVSKFKDSVDFFLMQEVDIYSKRSHWNNQYNKLADALPAYVSLFSKNYDVRFIPIPVMDPLGEVHAGLASFSKYKVKESFRHAFEGNYKFPYGLFFLDRCFMLNRFDAGNGKDLIVINTHNSAYDNGSLKKKQMEQMRSVLLEEYNKGNYVIVGGDWNQSPSGYRVDNVSILDDYPAVGWSCNYDPKTPTHRRLNEPFNSETTYTGIIDFYVASPNVEVLEVTTIDQQYEYSDHQAVMMRAVLK